MLDVIVGEVRQEEITGIWIQRNESSSIYLSDGITQHTKKVQESPHLKTLPEFIKGSARLKEIGQNTES